MEYNNLSQGELEELDGLHCLKARYEKELLDPTLSQTNDWTILMQGPNMNLLLGDDFTFHFNVKKTTTNRLKFWLMCKLLPFKVTRWE